MLVSHDPIKEIDLGGRGRDSGFSLTEVLIALAVLGIILSFSLRFFSEQWRVTQEVKDRMEAHFAVLNAGRTVMDAIREAQSVEWVAPEALHILPWDRVTNPDAYYIADKDFDGIKDLYFERDRVPNPVASRIISWNCTKGDSGLWVVTLQAQAGRQIVTWTGKVRQRASAENALPGI